MIWAAVSIAAMAAALQVIKYGTTQREGMHE